MLKISLKKLNDPATIQALIKLNNATNAQLDSITSYRVNRICSTADQAMKEASQFESGLVKKYTRQKEDGSAEVDDKGRPVFDSPDAQAKMQKELEDYLNQKHIEVKSQKLSFRTIMNLKGVLNGHEIAALEPFMDEVPDEV